MGAALEGIRVLELGGGKALAYAGKLLRDLGAEVIKVEPPEGDSLREHGPFPDDEPDPEQSGLFIYLNAGKRGLRLDPASDDDRLSLDALLDEADVLLHSLRPAEAQRLAITDDDLRAGRSSLIVEAVTTFGMSGPYANWRGYAIQAYAGAGVAYRVGEPDREPLTAPLDGAEMHFGGVHAAVCAVLALLHRDRTGMGQSVDLSVLETVNVSIWGHTIPEVVYLGREISHRTGRAPGTFSVWGLTPTADGDFHLISLVNPPWRAFLKELGDPGWTQDERIRRLGEPAYIRGLPVEEREQVREIVRANLLPWLAKRTKAEIWELTRRAGIAFQPVLTVPQICASPQVTERGGLVEVPGPHPPLRVPRAPYLLSRTPVRPPGPPPPLDGPRADSWTGPRRPVTGDGAVAEQPLSGVRVLDLTQVWSGPQLVRYLADYGADVVSVRTAGRPWGSGVPGSTEPQDPMAWEWILRNRRSLALNLRHKGGRELFLQLATVADVVIDNFSPRTMPSLGLDHAVLAAANPRLIVVAMPATGSSGPWSDLTTYGPSLAALYGTMSLNGYPEDRRVVPDAAELDPLVAGFGALAVLAALAERNRSGRGQVIELSQGEAGLAGIAEAVIEHVWNDRDLGPVGNTHRALAPHGIYPCVGEDQWIAIACGSNDEWRALVHVAGRGDWVDRPEYRDLAARRASRAALDGEISAWTSGAEKWALTRELQEAGAAAFPVLDALEVVDDPHLAERRRHFVLHEDFPRQQLLNGNPWHLSEAPPRLRLPAPAVGAHSYEVLRDYLGLDDAEIRRLEESGLLR